MAEKKSREELQLELKARAEEMERKNVEVYEVQTAGRGVLALKTPIRAGGEDVTELIYDFNLLTGAEFTDAMDSDPNAMQVFKITYRQALQLFARAAAKETPKIDAQDIMERLGVTDAELGVQLAMVFFNITARAGRQRISRR